MSEDKMGEIIKRIRDRRVELGLSFQDLADRTGMSKSTLQRYEAGAIKNIPLDKLEVLAKALLMDPVYLLGISSAPIYEAAAGEGRINDGYPTEEYAVKIDVDQRLVRVTGRSMEPTLQDGDLVVVTAQSEVDYNGQIALVKVNGEETTLKRIMIVDDGLRLEGDNFSVYRPRFFSAKEVEQLPVEIKGVVIKLIRDIE